MYDLQWRLKTGVKADFSDYEKEKYIDNVKYLLGNVDDRIIFEQISITYEYKLLAYLFKRHAKATYFGVLGFIFASLIAIPASSYNIIVTDFSIGHIIISIITLILGSLISYNLGEK